MAWASKPALHDLVFFTVNTLHRGEIRRKNNFRLGFLYVLMFSSSLSGMSAQMASGGSYEHYSSVIYSRFCLRLNS